VQDCANTFLAQVENVFTSEVPSTAATAARQELEGIADDCRAALGRT
jgi:hypothetical protein